MEQSEPWRDTSEMDNLVDIEMTQHQGTRVDGHVIPPQTTEAFSARTVVLVEGISDELALEALARRRGRSP